MLAKTNAAVLSTVFAVALLLSTFVTHPSAIEGVYKYTDSWSSDGEDLTGVGVSYSDYNDEMTSNSTMYNENNAQISFGSSWGYQTATAYVDGSIPVADESSPFSMTWWILSNHWANSTSYGNSSKSTSLVSFHANYQHVSGNSYYRCDLGSCMSMTFVPNNDEPFRRASIVVAGGICFSMTSFAIDSCAYTP